MIERESDIVSAICDYLALRKHLFWRSNNVPVYDKAGGFFRALPKHPMRGPPDITVIRHSSGQYVGLDVKQKAGRLSPEQQAFAAACQARGAQYHVVRSLDDVQALGL